MVKIIELFESLQGEGPKTGVPSIFIRFCGCNMQCMFNCNNKQDEEEIKQKWKEATKLVEEGTPLKDLDIYRKGCDSYPAILPEMFNKLAKDYTVEELAERIYISPTWCVVLTGGEPMLHLDFIDQIRKEFNVKVGKDLQAFNGFFKTWWFETNGTIDIREAVESYYCLVISPKLDYMNDKQKEQFYKNVEYMGDLHSDYKNHIYFKFVVRDKEDLNKLLEKELWISTNKYKNKILIMPEGGQFIGDFLERSTEIANECVRLGFNFTPRLQNYLWKNEWGK